MKINTGSAGNVPCVSAAPNAKVEALKARLALAERVREACAELAEGGRFLHDDAPDARFGRECATAIRRVDLSKLVEGGMSTKTNERMQAEIVVLRDALFRAVSTLSNQIPFAPHDDEADTPFECMSYALEVLNQIRDEQPRNQDNWRALSARRFDALANPEMEAPDAR